MLILAVGLAILALTLIDVAITTLTMQGAGPLSSRVMRNIWGAALMVHRRWPSHRVLSAGGVCGVLLNALMWVLLLWVAWSLVFLSAGAAIVDSSTGEPADLWARVYYAGFTLFTLGLGDYRPIGSLWQVLTAVCVGNGLLVLTLTVTYLVPVVSAAVEKRRLAALLACLGGTPEQMLRQNWDGQSFGALGSSLMQLSPLILHQSQQHLAYPALHYFHSRHPETALPVRLAALDETLTVLLFAAAREARPDRSALLQVRAAIAMFLEVIAPADRATVTEAPGGLCLDGLEGIPSEAGPRYREALPGLADRRRRMLGLVLYDGWAWEDISGPVRS